MSSPIENAAREIVVELLGQEYATRRAVPITAAIIRRHLFPLVKPEDVDDAKYYWVKSNDNWDCELGGWIKHYADVQEIRGPVPMPGEA